MKQNIMYIGIVLVTGLLFSQASYATDYGNYDHAQGNDFQCATSPLTETQCEIENILKFFLPQFISIGQSQDSHLQQIIQNQQQEIKNQQTEIDLLSQLVDHQVSKNTVVPKCVKSGTGILCR